MAHLFSSLKAIIHALQKDFNQIPFIRSEIAKNLIQYFKHPEVQKQLKALLKYLTPSLPDSLLKQGSLLHKIFILTEILSNLTRSQATELIQN